MDHPLWEPLPQFPQAQCKDTLGRGRNVPGMCRVMVLRVRVGIRVGLGLMLGLALGLGLGSELGFLFLMEI